MEWGASPYRTIPTNENKHPPKDPHLPKMGVGITKQDPEVPRYSASFWGCCTDGPRVAA